MRKMMLMVLASIIVLPPTLWAYEKGVRENWIRDMEEAYLKVSNYTTIFHKREQINGKFLEEETIFMKFKKPFKIYMKWIKEPYAGRELLYVDGWNGNRIRIHEGGRMGVVTVNLDPQGPLAMKGNRHPITDSGIGNLGKLIVENFRKGIKTGDLRLKEHREETVYGRKTKSIELIFPENKAKGYYCHRAVINLDVEKKLPLKIQIYNWSNILIENYGYEVLKLNVGLTDNDFNPKNPEYRF